MKVWVVRTMAGNEYEVTSDQADKMKKLMGSEQKRPIFINDAAIMVGSITEVYQKEKKHSHITNKQPQLVAPTTELTDEQREANLNKISEMRQKFTNRLA